MKCSPWCRSPSRGLVLELALFGLALVGVTALTACSDEPANTDAEDGDDGLDSGADVVIDDLGEAGDLADAEDGRLCRPGEQVCATARSYLVCGEDGESRVQVQCDAELGCLDGDCVPIICQAFEIRGCVGDSTLETCNFSGTDWVTEECPPFWACQGAACIEPPCLPDTTRCDGLDRILTCDPTTGSFVEREQCPAGEACFEDECQPLCQINEKLRSYVGCEYWSVDLDNLSDAENIEHTVVLSNPADDIDAVVQVNDPRGVILPLEDSRVPAGGQLVIRFPNDRGLTRPGITDWSWQVTSSVPVTAHQFNPLDNFTDPFTNDGTLLLPVHALGERYWVMSWIHRAADSEPLNGFFTVVAVEPDGAEVLVRTSSRALVGQDEADMIAGEERTFDLAYGQNLTLQTAGAGDDLTGTYVESDDGDIIVFGGHECANVVLGIDRCDHMETQLLPVELLSSTYVATKYEPRVTDPEVRIEPDYWRVLAVDGATQIRTEPEIPGVDGAILATGEWLQIEFRDDFIISADRPVMVAHYMVGANYVGIPRNCFDDTGPPTGIGDPAMTELIPTEQFRSDYIVLTPFAYVEDYLNLAVPTNAIDTVRLDGEPVDAAEFEAVGEGTWSAARLPVQDGTHRVKAGAPFGLDAYGYSCHVSYAYPGGLNLEILDENR